jgi:hypothetical protein
VPVHGIGSYARDAPSTCQPHHRVWASDIAEFRCIGLLWIDTTGVQCSIKVWISDPLKISINHIFSIEEKRTHVAGLSVLDPRS